MVIDCSEVVTNTGIVPQIRYDRERCEKCGQLMKDHPINTQVVISKT